MESLRKTHRGPGLRPGHPSGARRRPRVRTMMPHAEALEARTVMTAIALGGSYGLLENTPLNVSAGGVLARDIAPAGNPLTVVAHTQPAHGSLAINADGTFTFTPAANYAGPDSFTYTDADGLGNSATGTVNLTIVGATGQAGVFAGPRLASVDSTQGALLNGVLGGLTGSSLNLSALDWNSVAWGQLNGGDVVGALQTQLGLASPSQALNANVTLTQVYTASAAAAQAEGNTALANIFTGMSAQVPGLAGTIRLGDLLQVNPNDGSLANANLNALDFVTGTAQLFNFKNVATTPAPVTISGAALGLGSVVNSVQLSSQVVEPPVYTTGPVGTQFHTAAIRLKLNLNLVNLTPDVSGLLGPLGTALGALGTVHVGASVGQLQLYTEVASGQGTIAAIDAIGRSVTLQDTPGVANVYLGTIADSAFFNRTHVIDPATDVDYGNVGTLNVTVTNPLLGQVLNVTGNIDAKDSALGQAPLANSLTFNGPFPQSQTDGSSSAFAANLLSSLATNLSVRVDGTLGPVLNPLIAGTIQPIVQPAVANVLAPTLSTALTGLVDPTLQTLGVGLGENVLAVNLDATAPPQANADFAVTDEGVAATVPVLGNDAVAAGHTPAITALTQPAHGSAAINPDGTVTYTPAANYLGPDTFTYTIADGTNGTSTATVTVQVDGPPVANNDAYSAANGTPLVVGAAAGVQANDTDPAGRPLSSTAVTQPAHGTLTLNADGSFTYTPTGGYAGPDSFTYRDSDGLASSNIATVSITVAAGALPPVANNDAYTAAEGTTLTVPAAGVLANDIDPNHLPLTPSVVAQPAHGTLTLNADGSFTYIPTAGYSGPDSFTYRDADGRATSNTATVSLTVAATPPVAVNDTYAAAEGTTLIVPAASGVLANDTDANGLPLTPSVVTQPAHGTLTLNADGSFTYIPTAGDFGPDSFTYRDSDGAATSGTATVAINVTPAPPVAVNDAYTAAENRPLTIAAPGGVLVNDVDPNHLALASAVVAQPAHGTLTLGPDGSFTYTPAANYTGPDSFTYRASDSTGPSNTATVAITVAASVAPPVANNDAYTVIEGVALSVPATSGVLANDGDPSGNPLIPSVVASPVHGALTLNGDGSFTYVPVSGYFGPDTFTYRDADGQATSNTATVSLTVAATPPAAIPDAYSIPEGAALIVPGASGVLANDVDANGLPLTPAVVTPPAHGALTLNPDGSFIYVPAAGYFGPDTFTYRDSDGAATSNTATVSLTVAATPPTALNDAYTAAEGTALTVPAASGVLANDADANHLPLTPAIVTPPAHGALTLNADGSFSYLLAPGYFGPDSFSYRDSDGVAAGNTATVSISVAATPPLANNDHYAVTEGGSLTLPAASGMLANDVDFNRLPLASSVVSGPAHGTLALNPDGSFRYVPTPGYHGPDSFSYRDSDGVAASGVATVAINVAPAPPVAVNDAYAATEGRTLTVGPPAGLLANDRDPNHLTLSSSVVSGPAHGTLALNPNGSFRYVPRAGYFGPDAFTYRDTDGLAASGVARVATNVARVYLPPVATNASFAVNENQRLTIGSPGLLLHDRDPNGRPMTSALVGRPAHGSVTLHADGSFTYVPARGYVGADAFTYRVADGKAAGNLARVAIAVRPAADPVGINPRVVAVQRYGFHAMPTLIVLTFNTDLDPARADNPANYQIVAESGSPQFGVTIGEAFPIASAAYNQANRTVTLQGDCAMMGSLG